MKRKADYARSENGTFWFITKPHQLIYLNLEVMRKLNVFFIFHLLLLLNIPAVSGQQNVWQSVVGELMAIDRAAGKATVKTGDGKEVNFEIDKKAVFLRIKPNEKNLENAAKISLSDVTKNSKILARGLIWIVYFLCFKTSLSFKMKKETSGGENSQKDNIAGTITAIDPAKKQIKARIVSQTGVIEIILDNISSEETSFYRYANDSLKFNNSVASSFDKIKVGDQFKSTGKMSNDSAVFFPKTMVFGTFRTIGGKITSIDLNKREFTIEDIQTKKIVKIAISDETLLKILSEEKADELLNTYFKNNNQPGERKDFKLFYDELSLIPMDRLAVGDNIIISAAVNDESAMTAFYLLKDVKPVFSYLEKQQKKGNHFLISGG